MIKANLIRKVSFFINLDYFLRYICISLIIKNNKKKVLEIENIEEEKLDESLSMRRKRLLSNQTFK